jgi:intracellular septation protein
MKIFLDFLPLLLFFAVGKYADAHVEWAARFATEHFGFLVSGGIVGTEEASALLATIVVIVATAVQVAYLLLRRRKIDLMLWMTFVLVVVLGGATIWFHNATFIKWKPSVLYWTMGLSFWVSQTIFRKNLLQTLIGEQLDLPAGVWQRLNVAWIAFFAFMGLLNLYVAYSFSTSTWFTFKAFGATALMLVFMLVQGFYLSRHLKPETATPAPASLERLP